MKRVTLKSLTMTNFKGEKERTTKFNESVTTIAGDNGLGKTRHFDAFLWLLFGKDTMGRENFEVKTRVGGEQLKNVECSVECVLDVDGAELKLKRSWVEDYTKPKGSTEPKLKGNHTECYWNDTPVNVTDYSKRVNEVVDETVFKMITNPAFFVNMPWKQQREQLFQLAGSSLSDKEIAAGNPEFEKLLDTISGKSLADFKTEIARKKKLLRASLDDIQPRIDQTYKMMPQQLDWDGLKAQKEGIESEIKSIDDQIADNVKAVRANYELEQQKSAKINDLMKEQREIIHNAEIRAIDDANAANEGRQKLINAINFAKDQIKHLTQVIERDNAEIAKINANIEKAVKKQTELRQDWYAKNNEQYQGNSKCPHCGQELPDSMKEDALRIFNERKRELLKDIETNGKQISQNIDSYKKELGELMTRVDTNNMELANLGRQVASDSDRLNAMPSVSPRAVVKTDIKEWNDLESQIQAVRATLNNGSTSAVDNSELQAKKAELQRKRDEIQRDLNKKDDIERMTKEIERLDAQGKDLAQQIADIERNEYVVAEFSKKKIEDCEKRINGLFRFVTFRLFDYTIEGNEVETCVPLVDGVPYATANDAGKINAGLDIINTLVHFYNVCAPIFIDRRESVNKPMDMDSQVIYLKVTDDKELVIY